MTPRDRCFVWRVLCALAPRLAAWLWLCSSAYGLPAMGTDAPLVLGVFPRHHYTEIQEMFRPLAKHLGQALGREARLEPPRDFESFRAGVSSKATTSCTSTRRTARRPSATTAERSSQRA